LKLCVAVQKSVLTVHVAFTPKGGCPLKRKFVSGLFDLLDE